MTTIMHKILAVAGEEMLIQNIGTKMWLLIKHSLLVVT